MTSQSTFTKPPRPVDARDFIGGGAQTPPIAPPVAASAVKEKRTEIFNLRLTPSEAKVLAKIAETTPHSRQSFILSVLKPALEEFDAKNNAKNS
jgi:hypothetical protein